MAGGASFAREAYHSGFGHRTAVGDKRTRHATSFTFIRSSFLKEHCLSLNSTRKPAFRRKSTPARSFS